MVNTIIVVITRQPKIFEKKLKFIFLSKNANRITAQVTFATGNKKVNR